VIAETQRVAEVALNRGSSGPTVPDYSLGLDPTLLVFMKYGVWKPLHSVSIGDELMGGGRITGILREVCEAQCVSPGGHYVSAAQLVQHGSVWVRAAYIWPAAVRPEGTVLHHLMVSTGHITVGGDGEVFNVRDYAEVVIPEMQAPYDESMCGTR
jgi:hypothetical protein